MAGVRPGCRCQWKTAQAGIALRIGLAEFVRAKVDLRERSSEDTIERFILDIIEPFLEGVEQFAIVSEQCGTASKSTTASATSSLPALASQV